MPTFALALIDGLPDDGEETVRVRALTKNGRNDFEKFCRKARTDGLGYYLDEALRVLSDLSDGLDVPLGKFKPLGTRNATKARAHPGEHEVKVGRLRIYCVEEAGKLIVVTTGHTKKGRGSGDTDQVAEIEAFRKLLKTIKVPLVDLPDEGG